jgi:PhnB protein
MLMRFKESPEPPQTGTLPPGFGDKIMHAHLRIGAASLMASDGTSKEKAKFDGISLALTAGDIAEAERWFAALSDGGKVAQALIKTFFSPRFGMLADRFGVPWMVIVALPEP